MPALEFIGASWAFTAELKQPIDVVVGGGEKTVQTGGAVELCFAAMHRVIVADGVDSVLSGATPIAQFTEPACKEAREYAPGLWVSPERQERALAPAILRSHKLAKAERAMGCTRVRDTAESVQEVQATQPQKEADADCLVPPTLEQDLARARHGSNWLSVTEPGAFGI